jgi:hypothetical protein
MTIPWQRKHLAFVNIGNGGLFPFYRSALPPCSYSYFLEGNLRIRDPILPGYPQEIYSYSHTLNGILAAI